ncbi:hypothetical protein ABGB07_02240 [Micromonosporaceae bacterium B7E4]
MRRVTIIVETDDQYVKVQRFREDGRDRDVAQLLAEAVWRVADTFHAEVLEDISRAVADAVRRRSGDPS